MLKLISTFSVIVVTGVIIYVINKGKIFNGESNQNLENSSDENGKKNIKKKGNGIFIGESSSRKSTIDWYNHQSISQTIQDTTDYNNINNYQSETISQEDLKEFIDVHLGSIQRESKWLKNIVNKKKLKIDFKKRNVALTTQSCQSLLSPCLGKIAKIQTERMIVHLKTDPSIENFNFENRISDLLKQFQRMANDFDNRKNIYKSSKTIRPLIGDAQLTNPSYNSEYINNTKPYTITELINALTNSNKIEDRITALHEEVKTSYTKGEISVLLNIMVQELNVAVQDAKEKINNFDSLDQKDINLTNITAETETEKKKKERAEKSLAMQQEIQELLDALMICSEVIAGLVLENHCFARTMQAVAAILKLLGQSNQLTFATSLHGKIITFVEFLREEAYTRTASKFMSTDEVIDEAHTKNHISKLAADFIKLPNEDITTKDSDAKDIAELKKTGKDRYISDKKLVKRTFFKEFFNVETIVREIGELLVKPITRGGITLNLNEFSEYMIKRSRDSGYNVEEDIYKPYIYDDKDLKNIKIVMNTQMLIAFLVEIGVLKYN